MNTQMKCSTMLHFIIFYTVCKRKTILGQKYNNLFGDYNLTPLDMHSILFQVYRIVSNQREDPISITWLFSYCKGGNFNIHIWVWFGYFTC